jgi:hypothetical protein
VHRTIGTEESDLDWGILDQLSKGSNKLKPKVKSKPGKGGGGLGSMGAVKLQAQSWCLIIRQ